MISRKITWEEKIQDTIFGDTLIRGLRVILDILYCEKRNNLAVQRNALSLLLRIGKLQ
jgi:hypothetical protein